MYWKIELTNGNVVITAQEPMYTASFIVLDSEAIELTEVKQVTKHGG